MAAREVSKPATVVVVLSVVSCVALAVSFSILLVAFIINGDEGISDNWVGYLAGYTLLASLVATLIAFVGAIILQRRKDSHPLLWIALYAFPALAILTLLVEFFVIE